MESTNTAQPTQAQAGRSPVVSPEHSAALKQQQIPGMASGVGRPGEAASPNPLTDPAAILVETFRAMSIDCNIDEGYHLFNTYFAPNAIINGAFPGQRDMTVHDFKSWYAAYKHAMPDLNTVLYDVTVGSGTNGAPIAWARFNKLGRFEHPLFGIPPTHGRVIMTGVLVCRFTKASQTQTGQGQGQANTHTMEANRPRIDYCEIYQDGLSVLNSLGVNLANHMPQGMRSFIKDDSLHAGGSSKESSIYDRMSGFMNGLGSISLPTLTSAAGPTTAGTTGGPPHGTGITEQARHAVEGITDTVSSLAERAKEALGIAHPTTAAHVGQAPGGK